jgi:hypothetical protein
MPEGNKSRLRLIVVKKNGSGQETMEGSYVDVSVKLGNFFIRSISRKTLLRGIQYNPSMEGIGLYEI